MNACRGPGVFSGCPSLRVICCIGWAVSCSNRTALSVIYSRWFSAFLKRLSRDAILRGAEHRSVCRFFSWLTQMLLCRRRPTSHRRHRPIAFPGCVASLHRRNYSIACFIPFFSKPRPRLVRAVGGSLQWPPGVVWEPGLSGSVGILPCCR